MDRLTGMEVFVRVVELGSLSAAAKASGISATMAGNHVQALEQRLGAKLLNRTTRRQSLTEIGSAYYAQCQDVLARIENAERSALEMHIAPRGRLRVSAPTTLGAHLLVPALASYLNAFPEIEIDLQLSDRLIDLAEEGFDVAFRFGVLPDSGLIARPLRSLNRVICASPEYLSRHGTPKTPDSLSTHNCLAFRYIIPERDWVFTSATTQSIRTKGQLTVNDGQALLQAARSGIGIAMLPEYLVAPLLANGQLVSLFPNYNFARAPLQLVYLPDRLMTPKMKSFITFVIGAMG